MNTFKNLYGQVTSFENLYQAYRLARRGKRDRPVVAGDRTTEALKKLEALKVRLPAATGFFSVTHLPSSVQWFNARAPA